MNKFYVFILALVLAVPLPADASNQRIGVITATTTAKNNGDTAAPFTIKHQAVEVQCDAAACAVEGLDDTVTASCSTDLRYDSNVIFPVRFSGDVPSKRYLSVVAVSGTVNCKVVTPL